MIILQKMPIIQRWKMTDGDGEREEYVFLGTIRCMWAFNNYISCPDKYQLHFPAVGEMGTL